MIFQTLFLLLVKVVSVLIISLEIIKRRCALESKLLERKLTADLLFSHVREKRELHVSSNEIIEYPATFFLSIWNLFIPSDGGPRWKRFTGTTATMICGPETNVKTSNILNLCPVLRLASILGRKCWFLSVHVYTLWISIGVPCNIPMPAYLCYFKTVCICFVNAD